MNDEFRFTLTAESGEEFSVGLDVLTALRLWHDLGCALQRYRGDLRAEIARRRTAGETAGVDERAH